MTHLIISLHLFGDHRPELEVVIAHSGASEIERLNLFIVNDGDPSKVMGFLLPTDTSSHFHFTLWALNVVLATTCIIRRSNILKLPKNL